MTWVFVVLSAVAVVVIALVVVGRVTAELAASPPTPRFEMNDALQYVADRLSDETTAQLSFGDVEVIIGWHLDYLRAKGVATDAADDGRVSGPLVADDEEAVAYVIGCATEEDGEITDEQIVEVLEANTGYLAAIGAIGGAVDPPGDPAPSPDP